MPAEYPSAPGGGSNWAYVLDQSIPSDSWIIQHNLGGFPNVTIVDSTGAVLETHLDYVSANQIVATFSGPVSGKAYVS